jgi:hypothetical protein
VEFFIAVKTVLHDCKISISVSHSLSFPLLPSILAKCQGTRSEITAAVHIPLDTSHFLPRRTFALGGGEIVRLRLANLVLVKLHYCTSLPEKTSLPRAISLFFFPFLYTAWQPNGLTEVCQ